MNRGQQSTYREESQAAAKIRALRRHAQNQQRIGLGGGPAMARGGDPVGDHAHVLGIVHHGPGTAADGGPTFTPAVKVAGYGGTTGFGITPQSNYPTMVALFSEDGAPPVSTAEQPAIPFELFEAVQERLGLAKAANEKAEAELAAKAAENAKAKATLAVATDEITALKAKVKAQGGQLDEARKQIQMLVEVASATDLKVFKLQDLNNDLQTQYAERVRELTAKNFKTSDALVAMAQKDSVIAALKRENAEMARRLRRLDGGRGNNNSGAHGAAEDNLSNGSITLSSALLMGGGAGVGNSTDEFGPNNFHPSSLDVAGESSDDVSVASLAAQALELHRRQSAAGGVTTRDTAGTPNPDSPPRAANQLRAILKQMAESNGGAAGRDRVAALEAERQLLAGDLAELSRAYDEVRRRSEATARAHSEHSMALEDTLMRIYNANTAGRAAGVGSSYFFRSGMAAASGMAGAMGGGGGNGSRAHSRSNSLAPGMGLGSSGRSPVSAAQFATGLGGSSSPSAVAPTASGILATASAEAFASSNPMRFAALADGVKTLSSGLLLGPDTYAEFSNSSLPIVSATLQGAGGLAEAAGDLCALLASVEADTSAALSIADLRETIAGGLDPSGAGLAAVQKKFAEALTTIRNALRAITVEEMEGRIAAAKQGLTSSSAAAAAGGRAGRMLFVDDGGLSRVSSNSSQQQRRRQSVCVTDTDNSLMVRGGGVSSSNFGGLGIGGGGGSNAFGPQLASGHHSPASSSAPSQASSPMAAASASAGFSMGGGSGRRQRSNSLSASQGSGASASPSSHPPHRRVSNSLSPTRIAGAPTFGESSHVTAFLRSSVLSSSIGAPSSNVKGNSKLLGGNRRRAPVADLHASLVLTRLMLRRSLLYGAGLQTALEVALKLLARARSSAGAEDPTAGGGNNVILADVMPQREGNGGAMPPPEALRTATLLHPLLKEAIDHGRGRHGLSGAATIEATDGDIVACLEAYYAAWMALGVNVVDGAADNSAADADASGAPPLELLSLDMPAFLVGSLGLDGLGGNSNNSSDVGDDLSEEALKALIAESASALGLTVSGSSNGRRGSSFTKLSATSPSGQYVANRKVGGGQAASSSPLGGSPSAAYISKVSSQRHGGASPPSPPFAGGGLNKKRSPQPTPLVADLLGGGMADSANPVAINPKANMSSYSNSLMAGGAPAAGWGGNSMRGAGGSNGSGRPSLQLGLSLPFGASPPPSQGAAVDGINNNDPTRSSILKAAVPLIPKGGASNSMAPPTTSSGRGNKKANSGGSRGGAHLRLGGDDDGVLRVASGMQRSDIESGLPMTPESPSAETRHTQPRVGSSGKGAVRRHSPPPLGQQAWRGGGGSPKALSPSASADGPPPRFKVREDDQREATGRRQRSLHAFLERQQSVSKRRGNSGGSAGGGGSASASASYAGTAAPGGSDTPPHAIDGAESDGTYGGSSAATTPRVGASGGPSSRTGSVSKAAAEGEGADAVSRRQSIALRRASLSPQRQPVRLGTGVIVFGSAPVGARPAADGTLRDDSPTANGLSHTSSGGRWPRRDSKTAAGGGSPLANSRSRSSPRARSMSLQGNEGGDSIDGGAALTGRRLSVAKQCLSMPMTPRDEMIAAVANFAAATTHTSASDADAQHATPSNDPLMIRSFNINTSAAKGAAARTSPPRSRRSIDFLQQQQLLLQQQQMLGMNTTSSSVDQNVVGPSFSSSSGGNGAAAEAVARADSIIAHVETYANPTNPFAGPPPVVATNGLIDLNSHSSLMVQSTFLIDTLPEGRMAYVMGSGTGVPMGGGGGGGSAVAGGPTTASNPSPSGTIGGESAFASSLRGRGGNTNANPIGLAAQRSASILAAPAASDSQTQQVHEVPTAASTTSVGPRAASSSTTVVIGDQLPPIGGQSSASSSLSGRATGLSGGRVAIAPPKDATINGSVGGFLPFLAPKRKSPLVGPSTGGPDLTGSASYSAPFSGNVGNGAEEVSAAMAPNASLHSAAELQSQLLLKIQQLSGGESIPSRASVNNLALAPTPASPSAAVSGIGAAPHASPSSPPNSHASSKLQPAPPTRPIPVPTSNLLESSSAAAGGNGNGGIAGGGASASTSLRVEKAPTGHASSVTQSAMASAATLSGSHQAIPALRPPTAAGSESAAQNGEEEDEKQTTTAAMSISDEAAIAALRRPIDHSLQGTGASAAVLATAGLAKNNIGAFVPKKPQGSANSAGNAQIAPDRHVASADGANGGRRRALAAVPIAAASARGAGGSTNPLLAATHSNAKSAAAATVAAIRAVAPSQAFAAFGAASQPPSGAGAGVGLAVGGRRVSTSSGINGVGQGTKTAAVEEPSSSVAVASVPLPRHIQALVGRSRSGSLQKPQASVAKKSPTRRVPETAAVAEQTPKRPTVSEGEGVQSPSSPEGGSGVPTAASPHLELRTAAPTPNPNNATVASNDNASPSAASASQPKPKPQVVGPTAPAPRPLRGQEAIQELIAKRSATHKK